ncbi:MAG: tetratricopeptide repeat protein [Pedosphaera sp.]|nr:tetratricopeptide repeat protein [Pedosphaera sp.]
MLIMTTRAGFPLFRASILTCLLLLCCLGQTMAGEIASASTLPPANTEASAANSQDALRSFLQIQEQLHNTQAALEKNRSEAEAAAVRNAAILEERLNQIEKSMATQRLEELKDLQRSNRSVLTAAGAFALTAFAVLLFTAFLQWSAVNRLASVAAALPTGRALGAGSAPATLGTGGTQVMSVEPMEQSSVRLLDVLDRLEKRILEMEHSLQSNHKLTEGTSTNGHGDPKALASETAAASPTESSAPATSEKAATIITLLGKAQSLLKLDQPENALDTYNQILELDPSNTEALVKKGTALERLQRLNEAIVCYDRAIATDNSMTMAYLYKGGVFNQMERYSEALECYEKALATKEKSHAA